MNLKKVFEDDNIIYTPIAIFKYNCSIDCSKSSLDLRHDLRKEIANGNNIVGLLVYKSTGEWTWVEE